MKQDSRFVRFHSLQALVWQLCYMALFFICGIGFAISIMTSVPHHLPAAHTRGPPPGFLIFFLLFWVLAMGGWVVNVILGVVYGIKASRGEWAEYPVIGTWCLPATN